MSYLRVRPKSILDASMFTRNADVNVKIYQGSTAPVYGSNTGLVTSFGKNEMFDDGFKISSQLFSSSSWEIGSTNAEQLNIELYNEEGKWRTCRGLTGLTDEQMKTYAWKNKYLVVEINYFSGTAHETVHFGTFKVTEATVEQYKVSLTAISTVSSLDTNVTENRLRDVFTIYRQNKGYTGTTPDIYWKDWFDFVRYYMQYSSVSYPPMNTRSVKIDVATLTSNLDAMMTIMGHNASTEKVTLKKIWNSVKTVKDFFLIPAMVTALPYSMGTFLNSDDPYEEYDADEKFMNQVVYGLTQPAYPVQASVSTVGYIESSSSGFIPFVSSSDTRWESTVGDVVEFTGIRYNRDGEEYLFAGDSTGIILEVDRTGTHELLRDLMSDAQIEAGWNHFFVTRTYLTNFSIHSMNLYDIGIGHVIKYRDVWDKDHDVLITSREWRLNRPSNYSGDIMADNSSVATSEVQNTATGWNHHYNPMITMNYQNSSSTVANNTVSHSSFTGYAPGVYAFVINVAWASNSSGLRTFRVGTNTSSQPSESRINTARSNATSGGQCHLQLVYYDTIESADDTLDVFTTQTSGSSLTTYLGVRAFKIG